MSIVTDLTIARLPAGRRCNFLIIKSDFTPFTIATSVPFLPCPSLLVTIVYNSPLLSEDSSMARCSPRLQA